MPQRTSTLAIGLVAGLLSLAPIVASAQSAQPATQKFFANINFGGQLASRTVSSAAQKSVYDETASLASTQKIGSGFLFDIGGGYRVWNDVFVGLIVSRFSNNQDASYTASIPDPFFFNRPVTKTGTVTNLERTEVGFYPHALWIFPVTDKFDVAGALGLSIIKMTQDLVGSFDVPAGTQDLQIHETTEKGTAKGVYVALDLIYNITERYAAGAFVRYTGGSVDLPSAGKQNVGGAQVGGGLRLRF